MVFVQSTQLNTLISLTGTIKKSLNNDEIVCGVFIDLQKAFDTINHETRICWRACHACQCGLRAHVPSCQKLANISFLRANVPINVPINVPTCQRRANFSNWHVNGPKGMPISKLCLPKDVPVFQLFFKKKKNCI